MNARRIGMEFWNIVVVSANDDFPILFSDMGTDFDDLFTATCEAINEDGGGNSWPEIASYREDVRAHGQFTDVRRRSITMTRYTIVIPIGPELSIHPGGVADVDTEPALRAATRLAPLRRVRPRAAPPTTTTTIKRRGKEIKVEPDV